MPVKPHLKCSKLYHYPNYIYSLYLVVLLAHVIVLETKLKNWPYNCNKLIQQESSVYILIICHIYFSVEDLKLFLFNRLKYEFHVNYI